MEAPFIGAERSKDEWRLPTTLSNVSSYLHDSLRWNLRNLFSKSNGKQLASQNTAAVVVGHDLKLCKKSRLADGRVSGLSKVIYPRSQNSLARFCFMTLRNAALARTFCIWSTFSQSAN